MSYTKLDLLQGLADMGLTGQETILIHSSMKSIGPVDGGVDTVLDALMEFSGLGCCCCPPTPGAPSTRPTRCLMCAPSPCCVGILPELFRQRPGVVRSLHPTHSIAGYGQQAVSYLAGEELRNTPCTPGGCYDRLKDVGGKILLVGVTHARNTYIHSIEEVLNVPHRLADQPMKLQSVDTDGSAHTVYMRSHYNAQQPHISEDFVKLTQAYLDCGAAQNTPLWRCQLHPVRCRRLFRVTRHVLAPDPECIVTAPSIPPERWAGFHA